MDTPRILSLAGTAHPKALVQHVDPANGILMFAWLDANGNRVDSGNSGARFTPQIGAEQPDGSILYDEVDDAVLIDAIENPPVEVPLVPQEVTRRQLFLALYTAGITRSQIREMLSGNENALIEYEEALTFERSHPLIESLGQAIGLTKEQVDNLFRSAASF